MKRLLLALCLLALPVQAQIGHRTLPCKMGSDCSGAASSIEADSFISGPVGIYGNYVPWGPGYSAVFTATNNLILGGIGSAIVLGAPAIDGVLLYQGSGKVSWGYLALYPSADNGYDLGIAVTNRYRKAYLMNLSLGAVPAYATNAAALSGGLTAGDVYYTDVAGEYVLKVTH